MITNIIPIPLMILFTFGSTTSIYSDYKIVPSRSEWNSSCMATALKENGLDNGKFWASVVDKSFALSNCTCRHEHVKDLGIMSFNDFVFAYQKCREEFTEDHINTFTKYLKIYLKEKDK
tara:strand:+ start:72 stop:428 length:357 start_codon:yes stop_codon:yes gene_type:complete